MVTARGLKAARALVRAALDERLAACANLVAGLESHYWWQGKIERSRKCSSSSKDHAALSGAAGKLV